ncbi:hypothetical protein FQR65_LT14439 [Abscondita terminalis]|nr:hypothetical protein FQR65_LT14439 [Abscondita terminalis]
MENAVMFLFFDDQLDVNLIGNIAENLVQPLNYLQIQESAIKARDENYYEDVIPRYTDTQFKEHFRMTREAFEVLLNTLGQQIGNVNYRIPLQKKLLLCIWVPSKQESFLAASDRFGLATNVEDLELANKMIAAACILHNFLRKNSNEEHEENDHNMEENDVVNIEDRDHYIEAAASQKRNAIVALLH